MKLRVLSTDVHLLNMQTRMPFKFGIVTMTQTPHAFVRLTLDVDGRHVSGIAADHLPPKWFTKNPATSIADDQAEMLKVIQTACDIARSTGRVESVFDLWRRIYQGQIAWGGGWAIPPLLSGFGTGLVERAILDAFCRDQGITFSQAVRENRLGIRLGDVHPNLRGSQPIDLLPSVPLRTISVRHTVGMSDPLTDAEIPPAERLDDGLPQSLEDCIRAYGLRYFKIKLLGDAERDVDRVRRIADVIARTAGDDYLHTLDGNENFKAVEPFRRFWERLMADPALAAFLRKLIFVEQPFHRDVALDAAALADFSKWGSRPPTIIDESDGQIESVATAIGLGYAGASHKNCKGVIKGIANACLLEHHERADPAARHILSGEDLSNVPPVSLQQDLAVMATLGISHVERNGHHYFRGLTTLPDDLADAVLAAHPDLFHRSPRGFPSLRIDAGQILIDSVVDAPFGTTAQFDSGRFMPAGAWRG